MRIWAGIVGAEGAASRDPFVVDADLRRPDETTEGSRTLKIPAAGITFSPGVMEMDDRYLAIQVVMMPRDTNPMGSIFGGVILSYIDQAGAIGARREIARAGGAAMNVVTVAMNRVEFKKPVLVGDVVRFLTRRIRVGRTSIAMWIDVEAERGADVLQVTEAEVIYVGVDPIDRRPIPLLPS